MQIHMEMEIDMEMEMVEMVILKLRRRVGGHISREKILGIGF